MNVLEDGDELLVSVKGHSGAIVHHCVFRLARRLITISPPREEPTLGFTGARAKSFWLQLELGYIDKRPNTFDKIIIHNITLKMH